MVENDYPKNFGFAGKKANVEMIGCRWHCSKQVQTLADLNRWPCEVFGSAQQMAGSFNRLNLQRRGLTLSSNTPPGLSRPEMGSQFRVKFGWIFNSAGKFLNSFWIWLKVSPSLGLKGGACTRSASLKHSGYEFTLATFRIFDHIFFYFFSKIEKFEK